MLRKRKAFVGLTSLAFTAALLLAPMFAGQAYAAGVVVSSSAPAHSLTTAPLPPTIDSVTGSCKDGKTSTISLGVTQKAHYSNDYIMYSIEQKVDNGDWKLVKDTSNVYNMTMDETENGATIQYRVRARFYTRTISGNKYSPYSASSNIKTVKTAPAIPEPTICKPLSPTSSTIQWKACKGADRYNIYEKSGSSYKLVASTTSASYTFTGLKPGSVLTYYVAAFADWTKVGGKSGGLESGCLTKGFNASPFGATAQIEKVVTTASYDPHYFGKQASATVYYKVASTGYYRLQESTDGRVWKDSANYAYQNKTQGTFSVSYNGDSFGKTYYYRVVSYDPASVYGGPYYGPSSNVVCAPVPVVARGKSATYTSTSAKNYAPKKVVCKKAAAGKKKATFKWGKVSGASGYQVYYKTNGSSYKTATVKSGKKTSLTKKGLKSGKTYVYKVRAYKKIGGKVYYGPFSSAKKVKVK